MQKLQTLDGVLLELRSLGDVTTEQLNRDWRTRRAIERDLQVLIEVMIDVCQRLIALAGLAPTVTAGEAVARCVQLVALSQDETYHRMAQFRNFIVHHYDHVDVDILVEIVTRHLSDVERCRLPQILATILLFVAGLLCASRMIMAQGNRPIRIGALTASWGPTPPIVGLRDGLLELGYRKAVIE